MSERSPTFVSLSCIALVATLVASPSASSSGATRVERAFKVPSDPRALKRLKPEWSRTGEAAKRGVTPILVGDLFIVPDGKDVAALDAKTGRERWKHPGEAGDRAIAALSSSGAVIAVGYQTVASSASTRIAVLDRATGAVRGTLTEGKLIAALDDGVLLTTATKTELVLSRRRASLDQDLWRTTLPTTLGSTLAAHIVGDFAFLVAEGRTFRVDLEDGATRELSVLPVEGVVGSDRVLVRSGGDLAVIDPETLVIDRHHASAFGVTQVRAGDLLLRVAKRALSIVDIMSAETRREVPIEESVPQPQWFPLPSYGARAEAVSSVVVVQGGAPRWPTLTVIDVASGGRAQTVLFDAPIASVHPVDARALIVCFEGGLCARYDSTKLVPSDVERRPGRAEIDFAIDDIKRAKTDPEIRTATSRLHAGGVESILVAAERGQATLALDDDDKVARTIGAALVLNVRATTTDERTRARISRVLARDFERSFVARRRDPTRAFEHARARWAFVQGTKDALSHDARAEVAVALARALAKPSKTTREVLRSTSVQAHATLRPAFASTPDVGAYALDRETALALLPALHRATRARRTLLAALDAAEPVVPCVGHAVADIAWSTTSGPSACRLEKPPSYARSNKSGDVFVFAVAPPMTMPRLPYVMWREGARFKGPYFVGGALGVLYDVVESEACGLRVVAVPPSDLATKPAEERDRTVCAGVPVDRAALARDTDGDGWTDLYESFVGTDATRADSDGDGRRDPVDPAPLCARREPTSRVEKERLEVARLAMPLETAGHHVLVTTDDTSCVDVPSIAGTVFDAKTTTPVVENTLLARGNRSELVRISLKEDITLDELRKLSFKDQLSFPVSSTPSLAAVPDVTGPYALYAVLVHDPKRPAPVLARVVVLADVDGEPVAVFAR